MSLSETPWALVPGLATAMLLPPLMVPVLEPDAAVLALVVVAVRLAPPAAAMVVTGPPVSAAGAAAGSDKPVSPLAVDTLVVAPFEACSPLCCTVEPHAAVMSAMPIRAG